MPLLDHFHPPLCVKRPWHGFYHAWASVISFDLNAQLPASYFSYPNIKLVTEPTQTLGLPLVTDIVETLVFRDDGGPRLVGAVELVSPANKDRPEHREAFVSKCLAYLGQGVGLVIVDVVTDRRANLHDQLLSRLVAATPAKTLAGTPLYAAAYHPLGPGDAPTVEIWQQPLSPGADTPILPLFLPQRPRLGLDLPNTYERTCREQRIRSV